MAQKFDKLFRKMSPEAQKRVEERAKAEYQALALAELREAQDLTQVELAEKLGIDQGAVSKIERRTDMYLSTLRNVIQAMGGQLELTAPERNVGNNVVLGQFAGIRKECSSFPLAFH